MNIFYLLSQAICWSWYLFCPRELQVTIQTFNCVSTFLGCLACYLAFTALNNNQPWRTTPYWSVRRLKASSTHLCVIFNINNKRRAGHSHHFFVLLSCLVRVSEGEQRQLTDCKYDHPFIAWFTLKIGVYLLSNCDSVKWILEVLKVLKEAASLFLWIPQVLYIFEILSAIVTQVRRF